MRRIVPALFLTLLLAGALATALTVLTRLVQRDRAALIDQFTRERHVQLERAAEGVRTSMEDVEEDVRFAAELLGNGAPLTNHRPELEALISAVGKYKTIAVYGADGQEYFTLRDPRFDAVAGASPEELRSTVLAVSGAGRQIATSKALEADPSGWLRIFATNIYDESGATLGVVAMVVDTAPLMTSLSGLTDEGSRLLLLGAHGNPLPRSHPVLGAAVARLGSQGSGFSRIITEMRAGHQGQVILPAEEATRLALPAAESIVVYVPLPFHGGSRWSVATFSSTDALRSRDRALVTSLVVVSGVLAGFFALLGVSLTVVLRRDRELAEARRHAAELSQARDLIQKILDHVPTGLMALTADAKVSTVNRVLRTGGGTVGKHSSLSEFFSLAPPFQVERVLELVAQSRRDGRVKSMMAQSLFGTGGSFRLAAVPLEQPDDELASLLVIDDLSAIRSLEDQLVRAEKLSTVGVLAAGIAHEIGTPLGIVRGRAEYLAGKLGADSPHRSGLASIIEQIDRVSRVIRQLLDFSRVQPANTAQVRLESVFESVEQLLSVEAERREVGLRVRPPGVLVVKADADQLQQVLINLLLNGFDASKPGQTVQLWAEPGGSTVELVVQDTGHGMNEDEQRRIFDPFWTTKKPGQGTGLGLAVVAQVVRNHGGQLNVSSQPELGTTVRVSWPLSGEERS